MTEVVLLDDVIANLDKFNFKGGLYKNGKECCLEMNLVNLTIKQSDRGKIIVIINLNDNNVDKIYQLEKILPCDIIRYPLDEYTGEPLNKPRIICRTPKVFYNRCTGEKLDILNFAGKTFVGTVVFQQHIGSAGITKMNMIDSLPVFCDIETLYFIEETSRLNPDKLFLEY